MRDGQPHGDGLPARLRIMEALRGAVDASGQPRISYQFLRALVGHLRPSPVLAPPAIADGLSPDLRDVMRILAELADAGDPIVTFQDLAQEMDMAVDEVRAAVEVLATFGWVRVPSDPARPIEILRRPDMSHLDEGGL